MADLDSASLELLRSLPRLRQLFTTRWERGPLPRGFAGLKALMVAVDEGRADPAALGSLPAGLEELSLLGVDSLDLSQLPELPKLRTLVLNESELAGGPSSLDRFRGLRWLGLPENTTPAELDTILERHARLTTLEIDGVDSLKDLSPLRAARGLRALIVSNEAIEHLDVVRELKSLRFVGLCVDTTEAARQQLAAIRKALPDALVVGVGHLHLCLGSGWILLLLPATAACWLLGMRSRRRKLTVLDG